MESPPRDGDPLIGREVDHYRVLEPLGFGGMGAVYKAEDSRLRRTVALKFLPPELTRDPEAKERFFQEARSASALDHPNICTVHDLGEAGNGQLYLSMPAYDGETLKRKIKEGPLPVEEAVDIAKQVAQGLAKAHRQNIIHRDIKPANLMVTGDGIVKIIDFGLAKLAGAVGLTRTGFCVGTPAYMSPEQVLGEVDHRTDLWSLGVVLYEMLTGKVPFHSDSDVGVVHLLLNNEPEPLRRLRPDIPPGLERIVDRLLKKKREDRYASAESLLADLRELGGPPTAGRPVELPVPVWRRGWVWGSALAVAVLVAAVLLLLRRERPQEWGDLKQLTRQQGSERQPSLGRDFFVYTQQSDGDDDIFWQRIGGDNPRNLTEDSPEGDYDPAVSPDGSRIAFRSERSGGGIFLMGATGESVKRLTRFGYSPAWSPDGKEIVFARGRIADPAQRGGTSELHIVSANGGEPRVLTRTDSVQPSWSPGGARIAYWSVDDGGLRDLWTIRPDGSDPVRVLTGRHLLWNPLWSVDGRYLYFLSDEGGSHNLWRVRVDEESGQPLDEPEPLRLPSEGVASLSLAGDRIVYATYQSRANIERVAFDPQEGRVAGTAVPVTRDAWTVETVDVSPDGQWIAFFTAGSQEDLFVARSDGSGRMQLTNDAHKNRSPRWTPDGSSIIFYSNRSGKYEAWRIRADGSNPEMLTRLKEPVYGPFPSPDGRLLVFVYGFRGTFTVDLGEPLERRQPRPLPIREAGTGKFIADNWSPDGRWLSGFISGAGLALYSPETRLLRELIDRPVFVSWLSDSRRFVYVDRERLFLFDLRARTSRELLAPTPGSAFELAVLSPDGRALFLVRREEDGDIWTLSLK